jgi:hypothetical protein
LTSGGTRGRISRRRAASSAASLLRPGLPVLMGLLDPGGRVRSPPHHLPGLLRPMLAAAVVTSICDGGAGLRDLAARASSVGGCRCAGTRRRGSSGWCNPGAGRPSRGGPGLAEHWGAQHDAGPALSSAGSGSSRWFLLVNGYGEGVGWRASTRPVNHPSEVQARAGAPHGCRIDLHHPGHASTCQRVDLRSRPDAARRPGWPAE